MHYFSASCYLFPPTSRYSRQHKFSDTVKRKVEFINGKIMEFRAELITPTFLLHKFLVQYIIIIGRAVAQGVRLPIAAARVRVRAACGVCGGQSGAGAGFLEYFGFPCQSFHRFLHHHNHPGLAQ
jgi:hypothetical protein